MSPSSFRHRVECRNPIAIAESIRIETLSSRVREVIDKAEAFLDLFRQATVNSEANPFEIFLLAHEARSILMDVRDGCGEETEITLPFSTFFLDDFERCYHGYPWYLPKTKNQFSVTPLILAAIEGRNDVMSVLLHFSDINEQPKDSGVTALFMALLFGHAKTATMLLDRGAQLRACGRSALHAAARSGLDDIMTRLVREFDVQPDVEDVDGATPILYSLQLPKEKAEATIMRLRQLGASGDLDLVDDWTFKDIARAMGKESLTLIFDTELAPEKGHDCSI
ncbi:ankyrin repeat-containing domain protein [Dactylonectria estremocensis]|uniref:Ankyrin repeat-containing domain protein n=1 Tax=Dactylonectria estremocensis TaxID=1079267 RepID=A0A9P9IKB4_9HYPO|nr:ankyrin repeat-containing domain protein [Dactylonectria estremocensis]